MRKGSLVELREHQATWQGFSDALGMAVELVATPMVFALLGYGLDRWIGTSPLFAIVLGLFGLIGIVARTYFWYQTHVRREEEGKPWKRNHK
jgi:F0F1-type ATP synthase assembly protein I